MHKPTFAEISTAADFDLLKKDDRKTSAWIPEGFLFRDDRERRESPQDSRN
jgi:hypothetical protein